MVIPKGEKRGAPHGQETTRNSINSIYGLPIQELVAKVSHNGAQWSHLGPLGTIWGPSGDHHSKKLSIFSHFSSKYVIFGQKHTFQILDAHFPKRFRLKPHINQKSLTKVFQKMAVPNRFY